jgi:hypothetical protein
MKQLVKDEGLHAEGTQTFMKIRQLSEGDAV